MWHGSFGPTHIAIPCAAIDLPVHRTGKIVEHVVLGLTTAGASITRLLWLAVCWPLAAVFLEAAFQSPLLRKLFAAKTRVPPALQLPEDKQDAAVLREAERVESLDPDSQVMYVRGLRKAYKRGLTGRTHAVRGVSWAADQGMVFGLLGVNGAVKTTTFEMMAGILTPSEGEIRIHGVDVARDVSVARRFIGYCPQFDRLYPTLTVREHLVLFGRIKGLGDKDLHVAVEDKIEQLQLREYEHRRAGVLSGGNKRKLSVAIALIGEPPLVFLDEPSTGMDPFARRFMWKVIQDVAEVRKESVVVLTTHSMEECEALCSRVAIQVDGHFRCLGSVGEIKEAYGQGYEVAVKLDAPSEADRADVERLWPDTTTVGRAAAEEVHGPRVSGAGGVLEVADTVGLDVLVDWVLADRAVAGVMRLLDAAFPGEPTTLLEHHGLSARLRVHQGSLASLFRVLLDARQQYGLADVAASQATLEQVFNAFAREREGGDVSDGGATHVLSPHEVVEDVVGSPTAAR